MASLELDDSILRALRAQAQIVGLSVEDYLRRIASSATPAQAALSPDEAIALIESVSSPSGGAYQGTYPRSDIYLDHD